MYANSLPAQRLGEAPDDLETAMSKKDPTLPVSDPAAPTTRDGELIHSPQAKMHGNEPSRGAKIDAELKAEEEQRLREKQGK